MGFQAKCEALERKCTRCDGEQKLKDYHVPLGFGIYECDTCEMRVGYDKQAEKPEFLINKGKTYRYTTVLNFGDRLNYAERSVVSSNDEGEVGADAEEVAASGAGLL